MPSGVVHGVSAGVFAFAFMAGAVAGHLFGLELTVFALVFLVVGELLLSPDLDHDAGSKAYRRWGLLRYIWIPYQKMVPHRGVLSHCPLIGTTARLGYLGVWVALGWYGVYRAGYVSWPATVSWFEQNESYVLAATCGVELSTDLHLLLDHLLEGD